MPISTDINNFVFKLSSGGHVVGPSRLVSVKRSDALSVEVESYYTEDPAPSTGQSLAQIFTGLLLGLGSQAPGIIPSGEQGMDVFANPSSAQSLQLFQFLSDTQIMDDLLKPKSYLVYLFFDKRMMLDGHYSGIINVKDANQLSILQHHLSAMQRDGYFYTYGTNQSEKKVYFNNLTLVHKRGNIVQSNDYYPFGLTWENPKDDLHTYQGKELQRNEWSSGGLDMLDFYARMYNPLIGRWHNPDPLNQFNSPYNAMANNPVINIDPDGMWSMPWGGLLTGLGNAIFAAGTSTTTSTTFVDFVSGKTQPVTSSSTTTSAFGKNVGGALQILGGLVAFGQGAKMLSDGQFNIGDAVVNNTPEPYLSTIIYGYYYTDNSIPISGLTSGSHIQYYSIQTQWFNIDNSSLIGPREDVMGAVSFHDLLDDIPEGETAWYGAEIGNRGIYKMTAEELAEYEESKLSYGPDVTLGGKAAVKAGIKAARALKKTAKASKTTKAAKKIIPNGFKQTKKFGYQHGQKVYEYKGKYYSSDVDGHNGGVWKVFEDVGGQLKRIGTADENLKIFKN